MGDLAHVDVVRHRLAAQCLTGPAAPGPLALALRLGALQAQDYGQALWALGSRLGSSVTRTDVVEAIERREVLRTWPMRGTIHFVPAADARWMVALSEARMLASTRLRRTQLDIDEDILTRSAEVLSRALSGGKPVPRPELIQAFAAAGIKIDGQRGYHLLWHAAQTGLICLGPMAGKQQTFVLLDDWVPAPTRLSREEALAELARRYVTGHGPATVHDFAWWGGLTVGDARRALASAGPDVRVTAVDGVDHWHADHGAPGDPAGARLLAAFDEYLLGYKDRAAVLAPEHAKEIVPGGNGVFFPMLVLDGQVVGSWRRTLSAKWVDIELSPFAATAKTRDLFAPEAERYARFVELPLRTLSVSAA